MKARGMVVVVAFLLATTATGAVFMYIRGVKKEAVTGGDLVSVVVSKEDIPAGTDLDTLIARGEFTTKRIPDDAVIRGAVTSLTQLKGRQTSEPIVAGEQITTARMQGSRDLPGGSLGIPDGFQAMTVPLDVSRAVGGALQPGDHVTIWATFQGTGTNVDPSVKALPGQEDATVSLVPDVEILRMAKPSVQKASDSYVVTMALEPDDAQKVVFAQENGTVWLGLLPPEQKGEAIPPVTIGRVIR